MFASKMTRRPFWRSATAFLALGALALVAGACGGGSDPRLEDVSEVLDRLDEAFIDQDKLEEDALSQAAIQGIIDYLDDPHTYYLIPEHYQSVDESLSGKEEQFDGIGAELTVRQGQLVILGPLPGSPARQAGVLPGDIIVGVDGVPSDGKSLDEIVDEIRGPKGTEVVLTVQRSGVARPIDIAIVRDTILVTTVNARIQAPGIGYIQIERFDASTVELVRAAIEELRSDGTQGLILDLRTNPGGLVDAAVGVTSEFVDEGLVFRWQNPDGTEQPFEVSGEGSAYDLPLVVLVDRFSASASEIVTGAIQDHDRGTVVGTRTWGKGSVTILYPLGTEAGLNVTNARWLTPEGRMIEGEGLLPDVFVGEEIDFDALQRLGGLSGSLCAAFDEVGDAVADQEAYHSALVQLCASGQEPPPPPDTDEVLDVGLAELRKLMGG